jgi:short-subunit dehydrogenase
MSAANYALVTGASGGIGREIAICLARGKRSLAITARSRAKLDSLAAELRAAHGIEVVVFESDFTVAGAADALVRRIEQQQLQIDTLVNNAGFGLFGKHADTALVDEQQMIDLNITALTRLTKLLLPAMLKRGRGQVLNVASTAAFQPGPYMAVYYATKAYVLSYSEALAEELRDTGVSVTALCPGPTASGFQDKADMHDSPLVKGKVLPSAKEVAEYAVRAMNERKVVAVHGWKNWLMAQSVRLTPRRVATRLVAQMSKPA